MKRKKLYDKPTAWKASSVEVERGIIAFLPNKILFINSTVLTITGYTRKELIGIDFESILPTEDQENFRLRIQKLVNTQKTIQNWHIPVLTKQKASIWLNCNFSVIAQNREKMMIGSLEPLTKPSTRGHKITSAKETV